MRVAVYFVSVLLFCTCSAVRAASGLDTSTRKQLSQLEEKYFATNFDRDSDENRAARLEKLIFGSTMDGEPEQRIKNIAAATSAASLANLSPPDASVKPPPSTSMTPPRPTARVDYSQEPDNDVAEESSDSTADGYPRVTALEKAILGESHVGDKLPARLARMELKAFGHPGTSTDLSERTDALTQYAEQNLHLKSRQTNDSSESSETVVVPSPADQSDYPHITVLEKAILGQTFPGQPLSDRLSRMEEKAFGSPSSSTDMAQRTDALENYAEKKLHKKPIDSDAEQASSSTNPQHGSGLLSTVGRSLLGMVGGSGNGYGPGLGSSAMGGPMGMPMMMGGPMMGGPMGMGGGPVGFGGIGMHRRGNQMQQQPQPQETPPEDPLVLASTPPPPNARMLTKVGWCEMQVFGQTFPKLHLPDRLGKLNREINFEPGKSDVELMDDVGKLVNAVQARTNSGRAIGAATQPAGH